MTEQPSEEKTEQKPPAEPYKLTLKEKIDEIEKRFNTIEQAIETQQAEIRKLEEQLKALNW